MTVHPATREILQYFEFSHLPPDLQQVSAPFHALAHEIAEKVQEGPEVTAGLRKLLEAKDCIVRAALAPSFKDRVHANFAGR